VSAPTATIAIPSCNGAAHVAALLRSLLAQSRQDFALLLVDDASSDDTVAVATAVAGDRLRIVRHPQRVGLAANFAHAASLVETPFFCLAHQDDVYAPDYLATLLAALERAPAATFAHCTATAIDGDGNALTAAAERFKHGLARKAVDADPVRLFQLLWRGNFVCCPSVLFRTAAFRALGGFDTSLSFALDWELWFRCTRRQQPFVTVLTPLVRYRRHAGNATRAATRSLRRFEEELAVLQAAHAHGHAAGWLGEPEPPGRALRNNLVNEAFEDLRAGDRTAARQKLHFVAERLPQLRFDPFVLTLRALGRCGPAGVHALGLGRALAVRLGLG
jgi:glycosyltransferase involved in cell wall biosynthesis